MSGRSRFAALCVALLVTGPRVLAQSADAQSPVLARTIDQSSGLDLAALLRLASERSPDLAAARAMVDSAAGAARQAGLRANPELMFERREQIAAPGNQTMVGVSWPLELGRLSPRRDVAAEEQRAVTMDRDDTVRLVDAAIRLAYGRVLAAARALSVTETQLATARAVAQLASDRAASGSGPALEYEQAAVEVSLYVRRRLKDELELETSRLALAQIVGLRPDEPIALRGTLDIAAEEIADLSPGTTAISGRSDVLAAAARVTAAEARTRKTVSEGRPDLGLFAQFMSAKAGFPQRAFDTQGTLVPIGMTMHTVVGGATFMLPVVNRQQGAVAAAAADEVTAARTLDRVRLAAEYDVAIARARLESARAAVVELRQEALRRARANEGVVREAYALGASPLDDVLDAVRRVQEVEAAYTDALLDLFNAGADLRTATASGGSR